MLEVDNIRAITLVLKNFSRRKSRLILSSIGLILAIAVIVSTFTVAHSMQIQIGAEVEKYGPNIIVTPKSESISVPYGSLVVGNVTIPERSLEKIYTIPNRGNLRAVSPKIYGQVEYGNSSLLVVGMISEQEAELKKWWNVEGSLPQNGTNQILLGSKVESFLRLSVGSTIAINNMTLTVAGILSETGSIDDYSLFLPLHIAQKLLNLPGALSVIDVGALCQYCPVEVMSQQIMDAMPDVKATPIKQAVETRMKAVEQTANFSLLLGSIILAVGCAGIMNTMLASVHERMKEIGIFMSLGADSIHLYKIFILESLTIGSIGGLIGCFVGLASSVLAGPLFMNVMISVLELPLYPIPLSIALSVLASLTASLYPAWRASKIDPVQALRTV